MPVTRFVKLVVGALAGLALLVMIAFIVLSVMYSSTYIGRMILWQDADVDDYLRFPGRDVAAASEPFMFRQPTDPGSAAQRVREAMALSVTIHGEPDAFLEATQTQAFLVIQEDEVLFERYVDGFARDSTATSFSVAKSFVSALVGIAIEEGAIGSADDPITTYLPELLKRDARFADISVRNLLDMTSGIRYDESGILDADDALTYYFDDLRALALGRTEVERPPGEVWLYNNYNPLLLGLILERQTAMPVAQYLEKKIWTRIGTEFPASWSLDRDNGFEKMESGINARAIDFAKFGRLYLDGGAWDGDQIVPATWVDESQTVSAKPGGYYPPTLARPYGTITHEMYWWRIARPNGAIDLVASGNHGQYIFVAPEEKLIIARFGREYGIASFDWFEVFGAIADGMRSGLVPADVGRR